MWKCHSLSTFSSDSASQLDVLGHDGDSLGVDCAQVGVFEKTDQVGFTGFLEGHDSWALETKISLEVLSDFTDQSLEWEFSDQKFCALLVSSDFTESDGSWPVSVWFLDSTSCRCALTCGLGGKLLSWSLSSGGFTCGLLCTCHCVVFTEFLEISERIMYKFWTLVFLCYPLKLKTRLRLD